MLYLLGPFSAEYIKKRNGDLYVPWRNIERLANEAACLRYIREKTDIPVPKVLEAYEKNGSFFLWTEIIHGVEMKKLGEADRLRVLPQVLLYVEKKIRFDPENQAALQEFCVHNIRGYNIQTLRVLIAT